MKAEIICLIIASSLSSCLSKQNENQERPVPDHIYEFIESNQLDTNVHLINRGETVYFSVYYKDSMKESAQFSSKNGILNLERTHRDSFGRITQKKELSETFRKISTRTIAEAAKYRIRDINNNYHVQGIRRAIYFYDNYILYEVKDTPDLLPIWKQHFKNKPYSGSYYIMDALK